MKLVCIILFFVFLGCGLFFYSSTFRGNSEKATFETKIEQSIRSYYTKMAPSINVTKVQIQKIKRNGSVGYLLCNTVFGTGENESLCHYDLAWYKVQITSKDEITKVKLLKVEKSEFFPLTEKELNLWKKCTGESPQYINLKFIVAGDASVKLFSQEFYDEALKRIKDFNQITDENIKKLTVLSDIDLALGYISHLSLKVDRDTLVNCLRKTYSTHFDLDHLLVEDIYGVQQMIVEILCTQKDYPVNSILKEMLNEPSKETQALALAGLIHVGEKPPLDQVQGVLKAVKDTFVKSYVVNKLAFYLPKSVVYSLLTTEDSKVCSEATKFLLKNKPGNVDNTTKLCDNIEADFYDLIDLIAPEDYYTFMKIKHKECLAESSKSKLIRKFLETHSLKQVCREVLKKDKSVLEWFNKNFEFSLHDEMGFDPLTTKKLVLFKKGYSVHFDTVVQCIGDARINRTVRGYFKKINKNQTVNFQKILVSCLQSKDWSIRLQALELLSHSELSLSMQEFLKAFIKTESDEKVKEQATHLLTKEIKSASQN